MTNKPINQRHDLRHPISGKYIPRPENHLKRIIQMHQQAQKQKQALPGLARIQGILPLLIALQNKQQQPQQQPQPPMMPNG